MADTNSILPTIKDFTATEEDTIMLPRRRLSHLDGVDVEIRRPGIHRSGMGTERRFSAW
jgi:hypothetical protein